MHLHIPKIGDRVRLAIHHAGRWVPICWLRVGKDSSIYLGLAFDKPSHGGMVFKKNEGKSINFEYDEIEFKKEGYKSSRVSFKANSGEIHCGDEIIMGTPLFPLYEPRHLCLIFFAHPNLIPSVRKKNNNDYDIGIVGFGLSENHPLFGGVFILPWDGVSPITSIEPTPSMTKSCCALVAFRQADSSRNIAVQIALGHGLEGAWPKFPGIVVFGKKNVMS